MPADQKFNDGLAKGVILISDHHMCGVRDVAIGGVWNEAPEMRHGLGRDQIA